MMEWKRARKREGLVSVIRSWPSRCGQYVVEESKSLHGLPTVFRAMTTDGNILSRHRKKGPAMKACEKHAQQPVKKPSRRRNVSRR